MIDAASRQVEVGSVAVGELLPIHGVWFRVASADQEEVEPGHIRTVVVLVSEGVTTSWLKQQKKQTRAQRREGNRRRSKQLAALASKEQSKKAKNA